MRQVNIEIENLYESDIRKKNTGCVRASRFSTSIHKNDNHLKEGNSTRALEWARGFRVK